MPILTNYTGLLASKGASGHLVRTLVSRTLVTAASWNMSCAYGGTSQRQGNVRVTAKGKLVRSAYSFDCRHGCGWLVVVLVVAAAVAPGKLCKTQPKFKNRCDPATMLSPTAGRQSSQIDATSLLDCTFQGWTKSPFICCQSAVEVLQELGIVRHEAKCRNDGAASCVDGSVGAAVGVHNEGRVCLLRLRKLPLVWRFSMR